MNININEALDLKKWEEIPKLVLDGEDQEDQEENISFKEHIQDTSQNVLALDDGDVSLILKGNMLIYTVIQFFFGVYLME